MRKKDKKNLLSVGILVFVILGIFFLSNQSFVTVDIPTNKISITSFNITFWDSLNSYMPCAQSCYTNSYATISDNFIGLNAFNWYSDGKYDTASSDGQRHLLSVQPVDADDILLFVSATSTSVRGVTDSYQGEAVSSIALVGSSGGSVDGQSILWLYSHPSRCLNSQSGPGTCTKEFNGNLRAHNNKDGTWDIFQKECQSCPDTYIRTINAPIYPNLATVVYGVGGPYRSNGASGNAKIEITKLEFKKNTPDPLVDDLIKQNNFLSLSIEEKAQRIRELNLTLNQQIMTITAMELSIAEREKLIAEMIGKTELLNALVEQKARIINDLDLELNTQIAIVKMYQFSIDENARFITELKLRNDEQGIMIGQLYEKTEQQYQLISKLTREINAQSEIINSLNDNLKQKIELIQKLQPIIDEQYALIAQIKLSFTQQQEVANQLQSTVENDVKLISGFKLSLQEEAIIISDLRKTSEEKGKIIAKLTQNVEEQSIIIQNMKGNLEERQKMINALQQSLANEQKLTADLMKNLEEGQRINDELKKSLEREKNLSQNLGDQLIAETSGSLPFILVISGFALGFAIIIGWWFLIKK